MLASVVHFLWFLRYLLKSLPIVAGLQIEFFLLGVAVWVWLRRFFPGRLNLLEISLVGLALAIFFSETWSLFGGLYPWSNGVLFSVATLWLVVRHRAALQVSRLAFSETSRVGLIIVLPVSLVAAWNALTTSIACYDVTGYHLQAVRWAAEFGSAPGLANLHGRLGFNSALHPLAALLSSPGGIWLGREYVNSAIVIITLGIVGQGISGLCTRSIYALLLLPLPTSLLFSACLSSPQPDVAAASAAILFAWYLRDIAIDRSSHGSSTLFLGVLAGTMALLFKVSYVALTGVGMCVLIACQARSIQSPRQLIAAAFLGGVFCLPWLLRGYVTSGYPFFPAGLGRISFDWTVPRELIANERNWVLSWARAPYNLHWQQVLADWSWFKPWAEQLPSYPIVLKAAAMALIGLFVAAWLLRFGLSPRRLIHWTALFLPVLLSMLFWFFSAPSPRFAQATIWVYGVDVFYFGVIATRKLPALAGKLAVAVSAAFLAIEIIPGFARLDREPIQFPNYVGLAPPMALQNTRSGVAIWVPKQGSDSGDWVLPVTPPDRFNPKLEQRGPTLRDGFRIKEQ